MHGEIDKIIPIHIVSNYGHCLLVLDHLVNLDSLVYTSAHGESLDLSVKVYQVTVLHLLLALKNLQGKVLESGFVLGQHDLRCGTLPNLPDNLVLVLLAPETLDGVDPLDTLLLILLCLEVEFPRI